MLQCLVNAAKLSTKSKCESGEMKVTFEPLLLASTSFGFFWLQEGATKYLERSSCLDGRRQPVAELFLSHATGAEAMSEAATKMKFRYSERTSWHIMAHHGTYSNVSINIHQFNQSTVLL